MSTTTAKMQIAQRLAQLRGRTFAMIDDLTDDDLDRQFNPLMSPLIWDVGHVGNFEEFWLLRTLDGRAAHDERLDQIYNPFDNPRFERGELDLLERNDATEYLAEVRGETLEVLERTTFDPESLLVAEGYLFNMVVQHEAQHQETMLQALNLRDDLAPYSPAAHPLVPHRRAVDDTERIVIDGGLFPLGTDDRVHAYDNERPRHIVEVGTFAIDRFPVSNRRYAVFVDAEGYEREELWSRDGWEWRTGVDHDAPQGWVRTPDGGWLVRRFGHVLTLDPQQPVMHVSYWEAEAFAAFSGGRLPTEAEWEKAAAWGPEATAPRSYPWGETRPSRSLANIDHQAWSPAPVGSYPAGASAYGVEQLLGDVYEWTASPFTAYPGFSQFPYPEYSEVFFDDPEFRVLRGASWATSADVARNTFRNWDYRQRRQIMAGTRLAWDVR